MAHVTDRWQQRSADVAGGRLEYTVFPGLRPFVGCTSLNHRPISPVEAHQLLVDERSRSKP